MAAKLEKKYIKADDLNVMSLTVYAHTDNKVYYEAAHTTQVTQADLEYAFERGLLRIVKGTKVYVPVYITANKVAVMDTVSSAVAIVEYAGVATPA